MLVFHLINFRHGIVRLFLGKWIKAVKLRRKHTNALNH